MSSAKLTSLAPGMENKIRLNFQRYPSVPRTATKMTIIPIDRGPDLTALMLGLEQFIVAYSIYSMHRMLDDAELI